MATARAMETSVPPAEVEALLAQLAWMRRLARSLTRDAALADDLAQDACVAALEHRPDPGRPLRGWLATVLRNALRERMRGGNRRERREEACARDEAQDSALDTLARVATQRELAAAVLELREPYRSAILMRYFEELPPRRMARRLGVPVATVKSRIARGLALLRERLGRGDGARDRMRALAVLALGPRLSSPVLKTAVPASGAASIGALAVSTYAKILAVTGSLVAGVLLVQRAAAPEPAASTPSIPAAPAKDEPRPAPPSVPLAGGGGGGRTEAPADDAPARADAPAPRSAPATASPSAAAIVRGRVLDALGRGVADIAVHAGRNPSDAPVARTDATGGFAWSEPERGASLWVEDERWTTVLAGAAAVRAEPIVVVAPRLELGGWVVDSSGRWLEAARVRLELPGDFRARFSEVLDFSSAVDRHAATDAQGRFELPRVPFVEGARLAVAHADHPPLERPAPGASDLGLTFVLGTPDPSREAVRGRVVDAEGRPVGGARVSLAFDATSTDPEGRFEIPTGEDLPTFNRTASGFADVVTDTLIAVKPGHLPGRATTSARDDSGRPVWPSFVVLRLAGAPLSVAGRVVDEAGEPRPGARVWVADPTFLGMEEDELGERRTFMLENVLAGSDEFWRSVTTDERGRFHIDGLEERRYRLEAMDDATLRRVVVEDVPAGDGGVRIVLPAEDVYPRVRGRVVTSDGTPVPGARVFPMCDAFRGTYRGDVFSTQHATALGTVTGEEGAFELRDVPRDLVYLRVDGEHILPEEYGRDHEGGLADLAGEAIDSLTIEVAARLHFQVELAGSDPREIAILDGEGAALSIYLFQGDGNRAQTRVVLQPGRSATMAVSDAAREIAVFADGAEIARRELELAFGEVTTVRL